MHQIVPILYHEITDGVIWRKSAEAASCGDLKKVELLSAWSMFPKSEEKFRRDVHLVEEQLIRCGIKADAVGLSGQWAD